MHGFSDHCNNYYNLFPSLAIRGITVYAFDQRGWGRSASAKSQRGDSGPTDTVLADIRSFLNHTVSRPGPHEDVRNSASTPLFLMGHSMGGAEVLFLSLLQSQPQPLPKLSGIVVGSPWIALHPSAQPSGFTIAAGKLASKVLPRRRLVQKLDPKNLCRDQQVCRDYEKDDLCHDTGTLQGLAGALQRAADLTTLAKGQSVHGMGLKNGLGIDQPELETVPIWIGHGTEDRITSCASSQAIFEKLDVEDKTLKLYEGAFHKLHAEPDGVAEEFADDVANWILARTNNGRQEDGGADEMRSKL